MNRRTLRIAQGSQFGGLRHHRGVGRDGLALGRLQVVSDLDDELRDVIEQLIPGEDFASLDGQDGIQLVEPLAARGALRRAQARRGDSAIDSAKGAELIDRMGRNDILPQAPVPGADVFEPGMGPSARRKPRRSDPGRRLGFGVRTTISPSRC